MNTKILFFILINAICITNYSQTGIDENLKQLMGEFELESKILGKLDSSNNSFEETVPNYSINDTFSTKMLRLYRTATIGDLEYSSYELIYKNGNDNEYTYLKNENYTDEFIEYKGVYDKKKKSFIFQRYLYYPFDYNYACMNVIFKILNDDSYEYKIFYNTYNKRSIDSDTFVIEKTIAKKKNN